MNDRVTPAPDGEADLVRVPRAYSDPFVEWQPGSVWDYRSKVAGAWLSNEPHVIDIGSGPMELRKFLTPGARYTAVDGASRGPGSVVVNLNAEPLPILDPGAAAVLGVLVYIDDPEGLLKQLRQFPRVVLSYNHKSLHRRLRPHLYQGWVNDMTQKRLLQLIAAAGFKVDRTQRLKIGEALYDLRRID